MGNKTNTENWAAQERLRAIERAVWWRGWIVRRDLSDVFGISTAQASSDLQKYQELNPGALVYQMSRKRYEGAEGMMCVLHGPRLEEGMTMFLGEGVVTGPLAFGLHTEQVEMVMPPRRVAKPEVERQVFLAVCGGMKLRVRYFSVNSGTARWRWVAPQAFGHDGLRWHTRAWCFENERWQDFVLGRMADACWPEVVKAELPADEEWRTVMKLSLSVNPELGDVARASLAMDYGLGKSGKLKLRCRKAMRQYVEAMLRVPGKKGLPAHFVLNDGE